MADSDDGCPFLVPVMADRLWMYPMPAYCRRPDAHVKVPARGTFLRVCTSPGHVRCPGFLASADRGESTDMRACQPGGAYEEAQG